MSGEGHPVGRNYWRLACCSRIVPLAAMRWANRTGLDVCACGYDPAFDWEVLLDE